LGAGTLAGPDANVFKIPQWKAIELAKGIDHKDLLEVRRSLRCRAIFHVELGAVFIDLTKALFVFGNGDKTKLIAVAEFHSRQ